MRFKKSTVLTECGRCSGKGVAGASYYNLAPGYVSSSIKYGELTLTDDRGAEVEVGRDVTAEEATEFLEAERERLHAEVELRIDEMIAAVRRWDAGRPYPEEPAHSPWPSERAEATMERWKLTKAQQWRGRGRTLDSEWFQEFSAPNLSQWSKWRERATLMKFDETSRSHWSFGRIRTNLSANDQLYVPSFAASVFHSPSTIWS